MKQLYKKLLRRLFQSFVFREEARKLNHEFSPSISQANHLPAYTEGRYKEKNSAETRDSSVNEKNRKPVFITARFRSGSTLLWQIFNALEQFTAYYEPLNERRWFEPDRAGARVDATHRGVQDYRLNYYGLSELGRLFCDDWGYKSLYMDNTSYDWRMKAYIDGLIAAAPERPVLQFNRVDFRLAWLKTVYPEANILHLIRNPRDVWRSMLGPDVEETLTLEEFKGKDRYYLLAWCRDLENIFPCLAMPPSTPAYRLSYLICRLSELEANQHANSSILYEDLVADPKETLNHVFRELQLGHQSEESIAAACRLIEQAPQSRKTQTPEHWYEEQEAVCEEALRGLLSENQTA